jgi:serine/threonine protein kinase
MAQKTVQKPIDGKYKIIRRLGVGGMGQVFLAKDLDLGREVALKFLNSEIAANRKARSRFESEAKNLAKLNNNRLAAIYGYSKDRNPPYMALEYIHGVEVEMVLKSGPMPPEVAISIMLEVLEGIAHAHSRGVVHRDLKPSNILLTQDGHAKVIDFGIALDVDSEDADRKTQDGSVIGTYAYMSPEQATGKTKEIKEASDVYSLGSVFFTLLVGKPPLERDAGGATLVAIATEDAPALPSSFDPALADSIGKALEREREKRFQNAGIFKAYLENLLPPNSIKPDSVARYISESLRHQEDPNKTTFDGNTFDSAIQLEVRTRSKTRMTPPWTIYAGAGTLAVALALGAGLWALHVQRMLAEPVPALDFKIQAPTPPKGWDVVLDQNPPTITTDERSGLERRRASIEDELKGDSKKLKSLQVLADDPALQAKLEKECRDLKAQLDSIARKLSAR